MVKSMVRRALFGLVAISAGMFVLAASVQATEDSVPSPHDIMEEGHSGKKSLYFQIKTAVKEGDYATADEPAKKLKKLGSYLGKNDPPEGPADSWKKLAAKYAENTSKLSEAISKKDKAATEAAIGAMNKSCAECHKVHQP